MGKAEEPVFPYKSSINNQRPLVTVSMALIAILIVFGGFSALFFNH